MHVAMPRRRWRTLQAPAGSTVTVFDSAEVSDSAEVDDSEAVAEVDNDADSEAVAAGENVAEGENVADSEGFSDPESFLLLSRQSAIRHDPDRFPSLATVLQDGPIGMDDISQRTIRAQSLQSGHLGVHWERSQARWFVTWWDEDKKRRSKTFTASKFREPGMTYEDAVNAALAAAVSFRESHVVNELPGTAVRGVHWDKRWKTWRVYITVSGIKRLQGSFRPADDSAASIAAAHQEAVACRLEAEQRFFRVVVSSK